jgi:ABC-type amino acid transport substrate-binding protein
MNQYSGFNAGKKMKVAVLKDALPFANCGKDIQPTGVAVKIWEKTADKYDIDYEYVCVDRKYDDTIIDVSKGRFDVALSEFSVINRRYDEVSYTRPYFVSKMKVYRKRNDNSFKNFVTNRIVKILFIVAFLILFLYSLVRKNVLNIPYTEALYETYTIFFTNVKDFITINKKIYPFKFKLINGIWIFIRYVFFTIVVAQAINIIVKTTDYITDEEYEGIKKINVLKGTSYVDFVKNVGKQPELNNTNQEVVEKLYKSNYDEYWLDDYNVIVNSIDNSKYNLQLDSTVNPVVNDEFAIVVNKNKQDVLEKLNKTIVEMQDNGDMVRLCKGFMKVNFEDCSM